VFGVFALAKRGKLGLTWVGKDQRAKLEPRVLVEDHSKSYGDPDAENMVIYGDNLLALKALEQDFAGQIKCICIDPPYNTGGAFEHYDDGLEHSIWLSLVRERLFQLYELLAKDGSIWIFIDDDESHYLKILCDEIFGRHNFVANVVWQKKYSPQNDAKWLSDVHDHILVFAKNKDIWRPNLLPRTPEMNKRYKNPDNDPRGPWKPSGLDVKTYSAATDYPITTPSGRVVNPPGSSCWRLSKERFDEYVADNRIWFGPNGNSVPAIKRFLSEVKQGAVCKTIWLYDEVGHNQDAKKEVMAFNSEDIFSTPKPEKIVQRILTLGTNEGDWVLDSFAGSGTSGAVAHKMGRRWIMCELGGHCHTHIIPRMKKVIDGTDKGGISKTINYQGGGGFKYYRLAESLLVTDKELSTKRRPVYIINTRYDEKMLIRAICKIENFHYRNEGRLHGISSENRFLHVTTNLLTQTYLDSLAEDIGADQSLLIYCTRRRNNLVVPDNLEIKKIPRDLLAKCDFQEDRK
jgi:adenine-specific DNA-methyltransferase